MTECAVHWANPIADDPAFISLLDPVEVSRHGRYRTEIDRRRFLTGRVIAKTVIGQRLGRSPHEIEFNSTCTDCGKPHGPPRLTNGPALSISHSGERVGVALCDAQEVGLDVEGIERKADDSLISYALNDSELVNLSGLTDDNKTAAFFTYWTRKEALMKATGRGLKIPLSSITVSAPDEPASLIESADPALNPANAYMADLDVGEAYRASIAILSKTEVAITEHWWSPPRTSEPTLRT